MVVASSLDDCKAQSLCLKILEAEAQGSKISHSPHLEPYQVVSVVDDTSLVSFSEANSDLRVARIRTPRRAYFLLARQFLTNRVRLRVIMSLCLGVVPSRVKPNHSGNQRRNVKNSYFEVKVQEIHR